MKGINFRRLYYQIRHRYATMNNLVIVVALLIGAGWAWGSIGVMQKNYKLQQEVDGKMRQEKLVELELQNAQYEQKYYQSEEYLELSIRTSLGLANPGEKVLILPPNTQQAKDADKVVANKPTIVAAAPSPLQQWINFLFGGNRQHLQKD